jgi:glycosyltransferase involved in cell wall biosynthesis
VKKKNSSHYRRKPLKNNINNIKKISLSRNDLLKKQKRVPQKKIKEVPEIAISFMVHTASMDHFLKNKGIDSYFEALTSCLNKQSFKNFELIYVDTFYGFNKEKFSEIIKSLPYQVKHVEIHPKHRYWYDKEYVYISAAKNTGILYADGELCVTCDDAEFFPENLLRLYWDEYRNDRYMLALHKRLKSIQTNQGKLVLPISGEEYINDSRFQYLKEKSCLFHSMGGLAFAGTSFSLKDAIFLNGFNEKMDGCKSLEDCEFGGRLVLLGRSFSILKTGFLYILDHHSYSNNVFDSVVLQNPNGSYENASHLTKKKISNFIAIENYSMIQCSHKLMDLKANRGEITDKHIEIIKQETLKYRKFDPTDNEHIENFKIWLDCPNFNLEEQRKELRNSEKWIWKK